MSHHPPVQPLPQAPLGRFRDQWNAEYAIVCMARHSETEQELVVLRRLDHDTGWWVHPRADFFETIERTGLRTHLTRPLPQTPLGRFHHYRGGEYQVICMARDDETEEALVVYRQIDRNTGWWVRPHAMFFETISHEGTLRPRFQKAEE